MTFTSDSPATVAIRPLDGGGIEAVVSVPTYEGGATFIVCVERDGDGDWRVFIPWGDDTASEPVLVSGMECFNGILYLGAPE